MVLFGLCALKVQNNWLELLQFKDKCLVPSFYILCLKFLYTESNWLCTFLINVFNSYLRLETSSVCGTTERVCFHNCCQVDDVTGLLFKRLFPARIGPQSPSSYLSSHDCSVFIVLSRDVKIMSCELCHPPLIFNPFFARFGVTIYYKNMEVAAKYACPACVQNPYVSLPRVIYVTWPLMLDQYFYF